MSRIVVEHGSWGYGGRTFYAGATPCDDKKVLEAADRAPKMVSVEHDDSVKLAPASKIAMMLIPESGVTKLEDLAPEGGKFACRTGCDRKFNSYKGRTLHERVRHPDEVPA